MEIAVQLVLLLGLAAGFQLPLDVEPDLDVKEYWELVLDWLRSQHARRPGVGRLALSMRSGAAAANSQARQRDQVPALDAFISRASSVFTQENISMSVVENAPEPSGTQTAGSHPSGRDIDAAGLSEADLNAVIAEVIAKELKRAGVSLDDLNDFIRNEMPKIAPDDTTQDTATLSNATAEDAQAHSAGQSGEVTDAEWTTPAYHEDDREDSSGRSGLLGAANPSGSTTDVFHNGTDYFEWLEEVMKDVKDRMARNGQVSDGIAINERPTGTDGKAAEGSRGSTGGSAPDVTSSASSAAHAGFEDWKKSEDLHGGFDTIPKAVPMIVVSGNTYIKDIGNFRNVYQYGNLPLKVKTIEPNGADSGLELDDSVSRGRNVELHRRDGNTHGEHQDHPDHLESSKRDGNTRKRDFLESSKRDGNTRARDHLESSKRDGNTRAQDLESSKRDGNTVNRNRLLSSVAKFIKVRGHDDGEQPTDKSDNGAGTSDDTKRHDDGSSTDDSHGGVHGHDDGNTYHSKVHGHDDGDSTDDSPGGVHGHDDGNTYHSKVHGHDDGDSTDDSHGGVHGHDDGNTYHSKVHGHDDGDTAGDVPLQRAANAGKNKDGGKRDDGNTYNGEVHGHDDGGSTNSAVHGHDDGNTYSSEVHGHDDGGSTNISVHGHDDGNTYSSEVHGHDDGGTVQRTALRDSRQGKSISMTMSDVSLTVVGCALVVLTVGLIVHARRRRVGVFRKADYIRV